MRRTGGGTADNLPTLSALDNRLVAVMGGQEFATGDARWTVNPFPQSVIYFNIYSLVIPMIFFLNRYLWVLNILLPNLIILISLF